MSNEESDEIAETIKLHRDLATARDWTLGPMWRFRDDKRTFGQLTALKIVDKLNQYSANSANEIHLPSIWHASLYCSWIQHSAVSHGYHHYLFRGQCNRDWPIISSIHRPGVDVELEQKRADHFSRLLRSFSFNTSMMFEPHTRSRLYLRMGPAAHLASAQHYGIKTPLIDFTTEADVAAWFASGTCETDAPEATIDVVPLSEDTLRRSLLVLPPPFIERLYLQRGAFLKAEHAKVLADLETVRLVFPNPNVNHFTTHAERFHVLRDGGRAVDILPPETLLEPIKKATDDIIAGRIVAESQDDYDGIARELKPDFRFIVNDLMSYWAKYVDHFEDVLYQLVYSIPGDETGILIDQLVLGQLVQHNPEIVGSIISLYEFWFASHPENFHAGQINFLRQVMSQMQYHLSAVGYSQAMEEEAYFRFLSKAE